MFEEFRANVRASRKAAVGALYVFPKLWIAVARMKMTNDMDKRLKIAQGVYGSIRNLLGLKVEFNGVALVQDKDVMFTPNHASTMDFITMGSLVRSPFVMLKMFLNYPAGIGALARLTGNIGTGQSKDSKRYEQGRMIDAYGAQGSAEEKDGRVKRMVIFPSGTTDGGGTKNGRHVVRFSAGLFEVFYNKAGARKGTDGQDVECRLDPAREIVIQPVAIRVKEINGKNVLDSQNTEKEWSPYTLQYIDPNKAKGIWGILKAKSMAVEVYGCEPVNPKDFEVAGDAEKSAISLANALELAVRAVAAPTQTQSISRKEYAEYWEARQKEYLALKGKTAESVQP